MAVAVDEAAEAVWDALAAVDVVAHDAVAAGDEVAAVGAEEAEAEDVEVVGEAVATGAAAGVALIGAITVTQDFMIMVLMAVAVSASAFIYN